MGKFSRSAPPSAALCQQAVVRRRRLSCNPWHPSRGKKLPTGRPQPVACGAGGLSLTLGTSVVLSQPSAEPLLSPAPAFRTLLACDGGFTLESVVQSGTLIMGWFRDNFHQCALPFFGPLRAVLALSSGGGLSPLRWPLACSSHRR